MTGAPTTDPPPILAVGAAAIDEWYAVSNLPEPDGGAFASEVTTAFGGVGANVCDALDRLGRDVGLVSRVRDDEYADGRAGISRTPASTPLASRSRRPSTRSVTPQRPAGRARHR
ncbi:carbohydrate kinase, partial [Halorubrum saccharovorum]